MHGSGQAESALVRTEIVKRYLENDDELKYSSETNAGFLRDFSSREFQTIRECSKNNKDVVWRCEKSTPGRTHIFSETPCENGERDSSEFGIRGLSLQEAASERGWTGLMEQVRQYNAKRPT